MQQYGLQVLTLDLDKQVRPDILGCLKNIPLRTGSIDCVLAAEVLEHIPYEQFAIALAELKRVTRSHVIITLPAPFVGVSALCNFPHLEPKGVFFGLPYRVTHNYNGEHYWELGKRGFGIRYVRRVILEQGFNIVREFRPAPSLYCYFFVLKVS